MKKQNNLKTLLITVVTIAIFAVLSVAAESVAGNVDGMSMLVPVLKKTAVYSLIAVSMNLLNGFTGLFSLGHAGFMLVGAYTYAILSIPVAKRAGVYQYYDGGIVQFSIPETFGNLMGETVGTVV